MRGGHIPPDLRTVMLGASAWAGGLSGFLLPWWGVSALVVGGTAVLASRWSRGRPVLLGLTWLVAATSVAGSAMLRAEGIETSPVARLAAERAFVSAVVRVVSDPLVRDGEQSSFTVTRVSLLEVAGRGAVHQGAVPALVIGDMSWREVELGSVVRLEGRTSPAEGKDIAAVVSTSRAPVVVEDPGDLLTAAAAVRQGIRRAVSGAGITEATLVPALVVGDDQGMPAEVVEDFRVAGLTHLLAVSGTNLTLVVGFLLVVARWLGVRARGLVAVGALGVVCFVLLARTEPSVVRAATMGAVALVGMGSNGREKGVRALGVAVLVLLLVDPWLALSLGFVLSVLATAGILFLAPPWRDRLSTWLPRWAAEAVAVPLSAQLVCTPVVAAISDQVSLVAVVANMVVAPAVGPATVLGLAGGLLVLGVPPLGMGVGRAAAGSAWWITSAAERGAAMPTAAVDWPASVMSISLLVALCVLTAWVMPRVLSRRGRSAAVAVLMLLVVVRPLPTPGWPPDGWLLVACDVGQGDGLVVNAGGGTAVVVDAGPDPAVIDRCLDRLEVKRVAAVVLTHYHHDHVTGLPGVLEDRPTKAVVGTAWPEPAEGAAAVEQWTRSAGVPLQVPTYGSTWRVGRVTWQFLAPTARFAAGQVPTAGSTANNASIAMLVVSSGIRMLLAGDMEPEAQNAFLRSLPGLEVDVLKVPHHGSRYQAPEFLTGLGARHAVVSVGEGNSHGHPSADTLQILEDAGISVHRTDVSGDIAVVVAAGQLSVRELSTSSSAMR